jgi:hypothetical protein
MDQNTLKDENEEGIRDTSSWGVESTQELKNSMGKSMDRQWRS